MVPLSNLCYHRRKARLKMNSEESAAIHPPMHTTPAKQESRKHQFSTGAPLRKVVYIASLGNITIPLALAAGAVIFGLAGWSVAKFDGTFNSISEIILRVIGSFLPSQANVVDGNWASRLGAVLAALTTVTGAILVGLATLGEQFTQLAARYLWSAHTVVVGDTALGQRVAEGFEATGARVLHLVPREAPKFLGTGPIRVRLGLDAHIVLTAAAPWRARHVVLDLGADAATLALGNTLLTAFDAPVPPPSLAGRLLGKANPKRPDTLALCITDSILTDQYFELIDAERRALDGYRRAAPLHPTVFDENSVIARHTLARDPLFLLASRRGQARVHAVIVGFGNLGEKLIDQIMLTSIAGALNAPRITVLDRHADEREREFRAQRPGVLDTLEISFIALDLGLDPLEGEHTPSVAKLRAIEEQDPVTAIFLTLPTDAAVLRSALLLRDARERSGLLDAPVFYRWRANDAETPVFGPRKGGRIGSDQFVLMEAPTEALLKEIADPDGRAALARALHEAYLQSKFPSDQASEAWEHLPNSLRRANIHAADHLPAKLWSLGLDIDSLDPGAFPILDDAAKAWLAQLCSGQETPTITNQIHTLAKLEHERWAIERKLDGWRYSPKRDNARQLHPLLVPWEELKGSAEEVRKDVDQVIRALQFVAQHHEGPPNIFRRSV
jgi:hypothetical protein